MFVYLIWLIGVVLWNYIFPEASPLEDVVAAVILSVLNLFFIPNIKKILKL